MNEVFLSLTSHSSSLRPSTLKVHKCVFSEKWGQSLKVARYEMSAIKTGIAARIEKKSHDGDDAELFGLFRKHR